MDRHYFARMQEKLDQLKAAGRPEPIRSDGAGALDLGPRNVKRDEESPDMLVPLPGRVLARVLTNNIRRRINV